MNDNLIVSGLQGMIRFEKSYSFYSNKQLKKVVYIKKKVFSVYSAKEALCFLYSLYYHISYSFSSYPFHSMSG